MLSSKKRKSESTDNVDTKNRAILEMRVFDEVYSDDENKSNEQKLDKVRKLEPLGKVSKRECSKGRQLKPFQCNQCRFVNSTN